MSISSYTTVTMLDSRPAQMTISVPKSTDIYNRIITFKDLYGTASNSTITLVTRSGDTFEDGTFSTIMSNAYQTVNLYAGQPGKWLNVGATGGGGGDSAGLTTVSNHLNALSTNLITISTNLNTVSNTGATNATNITTVSNSTGTNTTNLNTVSNVLTGVSTNVTTISTNLNTVSNTVAAGRFSSISTNTISSSLIRAGYISSPQGYISSLIVDSLAFSFSNSFIVMGDIITTSVSTIQTFTSSLTTNNLRVGTVSTLSYIAFPGLQQGYAQTVIAEQTTTSRIRMQTTGPIVFEPGVSARVFTATGSNATPAMIITTGSNVGIGVAAPTVALDVAGVGRFTALSTNEISTGYIEAYNGYFSNIDSVGISAIEGYISTLYVDSISTNIISTATILANTISTNSISTGTLTVGGTALSARLQISTNNTTLTNPASIIIKTPNTSYFYEDYTNLTNYITISNYGAQNGDYINIVNTGNSGAPATFQVLDGSTGVSSIIRYIYPGHAGVVAYSSSQWWPL